MNEARDRLVQSEEPKWFDTEEAARDWQRKRNEQVRKELLVLLQLGDKKSGH